MSEILQVKIAEALNPAMLDHLLDGANIDILSDGYHEAMAATAKGWITACVCVGRAQEIAEYGENAIGALAEKFDASPTHLKRFGRYYREIVRPRIAKDGANATFALEEQAWYRIAIEYAPEVEKTPSALIVEAEKAKAADPAYTPAQWKAKLSGDEGSTASTARSLMRAIGKLAKAEDSEADDIAASLDQAKLVNIEEAYSWLDRLLIVAREKLGVAA